MDEPVLTDDNRQSFAVVAGEVGKLAERAAMSAKEIAGLIDVLVHGGTRSSDRF